MNDQNSNKQGDSRFFLGFFIGGLIGAVIIFLLGTKEGKKTGKILEERGKDLLDDLHEQIKDLEKKGEALVKQGEEIKEEVVDRILEKKEDLTVTATERLDDALSHIEKMQEQSRETTAEIRKRLFKNLPKRR
jgi:gas vesicle protein